MQQALCGYSFLHRDGSQHVGRFVNQLLKVLLKGFVYSPAAKFRQNINTLIHQISIPPSRSIPGLHQRSRSDRPPGHIEVPFPDRSDWLGPLDYIW
jgi:hypothetical protein